MSNSKPSSLDLLKSLASDASSKFMLRAFERGASEISKAKTNKERLEVAAKYLKEISIYDERLSIAEIKLQKMHEDETKNFKDAVHSKKLRLDGNDAFRQQLFYEAIELYTRSIAFAPGNSIDLALAYGNRSAAHFELKQYNMCLVDMQHALDEDYPKDKKIKLMLRRARCYLNMRQSTKATESCDQAAEFLKQTVVPMAMLKELENELEHLRKCKPPNRPMNKEPKVYFPLTAPPLSYGPNNEVPCASSAVKIQYNEKLGRHIVATRDINIGDIVSAEEPFVGMLSKDCFWNHCSHCRKYCLTLVPCFNCVQVMFCSKECQDEANKKYHEIECPVLSRFHSAFGDIYLKREEDCPLQLVVMSIRTLCTVGIDNLKSFHQASLVHDNSQNQSEEQKRTKGFWNGQYDPSNFNAFCNLMSHINNYTSKELFGILLKVLHITKCFNLNGPENDTDFFSIGGFCLGILLRCTRNGFPIYEKNCTLYEGHNDAQDVVGSGIYSFSALYSHACYQNVYRTNIGKYLIFQASVPIAKGTIVSTMYTDTFNVPKHVRQMVLKQFMYFDCECDACINDWPIMVKDYSCISNQTDLVLVHKLCQFNYTEIQHMLRNRSRKIFEKETKKSMTSIINFLTRLYKKGEFLDSAYCCVQKILLNIFDYQGNTIV